MMQRSYKEEIKSEETKKAMTKEFIDFYSKNIDKYSKPLKGVVKFLERIGDNDVMIISSDNQKQDILIPFMKAYILDVNLNDKLIKVDWDENF